MDMRLKAGLFPFGILIAEETPLFPYLALILVIYSILLLIRLTPIRFKVSDKSVALIV
jgi:hypothetical protein